MFLLSNFFLPNLHYISPPQSWSPSSARRAPLIKSKFCEDEALTELISLRRDAKMIGPGDTWGQRACAHVGPCCAPERDPGAADRGGWRVRAIEAAAAVIKPLAVAAAAGEGGKGRQPVLLDLALGTRGAGGEVWGREGEAWRVLGIEVRSGGLSFIIPFSYPLGLI